MASYISTHTGLQIDNAIDKVITNVYDKQEINTLLSSKVNTNDLSSVATSGSYTDLSNKPTNLSDFNNDTNFITKAVNDLTNYYKTSETYTKQEINNLISAVPKFAIEVVNSLPISDISTTTVYLLPSNSETNDIYKEYIYVNNQWELLGIQKTDLSNYYNKTETDNLLNNMIDTIYPVGAIYLSVNSTNPSVLFGGTWEQIKDKFLLSAGDSYSAGTTGGEISHTLTKNEMPKHSHTRGTMEITGYFDTRATNYGRGVLIANGSLFSKSNSPDTGDSVEQLNPSQTMYRYTFKASNLWSGSTSEVGENQAHNNMPPYLAVYVWKRVA